MHAVIVFSAYILASCNAQNLVQLATELGATTFVNYVKAAGLEGTLSGPGPFTVLAPTNAAFVALPDAVKEQFMKDKDLLRQVLLFHVTNGRVYSSQLSNNMIVSSMASGLNIRVNIYQKMTSSSRLYPDTATTVVTTDGAQLVVFDKNATNGVIHVISHVMFPLPAGDVPVTVAHNSDLGVLLFAIVKADLIPDLSVAGPLTLFAPTDAALNKLPPGVLSDLFQNRTALTAVLKYHVVPGANYIAGLSSGPVKTLQGQTVNITVSANGVMINSANVINADITATNGVVHEIDTVLFPPN